MKIFWSTSGSDEDSLIESKTSRVVTPPRRSTSIVTLENNRQNGIPSSPLEVETTCQEDSLPSPDIEKKTPCSLLDSRETKCEKKNEDCKLSSPIRQPPSRKNITLIPDNDSGFLIIDPKLTFKIGSTLSTDKLENFFRSKFGLPTKGHSPIVRVLNKEGCVVPSTFDDLEDGQTYTLKVLPPSSLQHLRKSSLSSSSLFQDLETTLSSSTSSTSSLTSSSTSSPNVTAKNIPRSKKPISKHFFRDTTSRKRSHLSENDFKIMCNSSSVDNQSELEDTNVKKRQRTGSLSSSSSEVITYSETSIGRAIKSPSRSLSATSSLASEASTSHVYKPRNVRGFRNRNIRLVTEHSEISEENNFNSYADGEEDDQVSESDDETILGDEVTKQKSDSLALSKNEPYQSNNRIHRLRKECKRLKRPSISSSSDTSSCSSRYSNVYKRNKVKNTELNKQLLSPNLTVRWIVPRNYVIQPFPKSLEKPSNTEDKLDSLIVPGSTSSLYPSSSQISKSNDQSPSLEHGRSNGRKMETDPSVSDIMEIYFRVRWLNLGCDHPEALAESESLASVTLPEVSPTLVLHIPMEVAERGLLSNPQLESSIYSARAFKQTLGNEKIYGYFLGDGTGCGKGRTISSIVWNLWNMGQRRHIWLSVGPDLVQDAIRDFKDIGAGHIPVVDLGAIKTINLDSDAGMKECKLRAEKLNPYWKWNGEGVIFCTYSLLSRSINQKNREDVLKHVDFKQIATRMNWQRYKEGFNPISQPYSKSQPNIGLNGGNKNVASRNRPQPLRECVSIPIVTTRLGQVLQWMSKCPSKDFSVSTNQLAKHLNLHADEKWKRPYWLYRPEHIYPGGLLCFDEAHKAKNLVSNDAEQTRSQKIGTSTGQIVKLLQDLLPHCPVLYASATGATELRNMAYMTRLGLWGNDAPFKDFGAFKEAVERGGVAAMECLAMDLKATGLYSCRTLSFNSVAFLYQPTPISKEFLKCYNDVACLMTAIYESINKAASAMDNNNNNQVNDSRNTSKSQFWGTQQRVFKQLLVSQKVDRAVELAKKAEQEGCQAVISLWGTGEERTKEKVKELRQDKKREKLNAHHTSDDDAELELDEFLSPPKLMLERLIKDKIAVLVPQWETKSFLNRLDKIAFPNNPLDDLIEKLGGPEKVAELSGRSKRLVWGGKTLKYVGRDVGHKYREQLLSLSDKGFNSVNIQEQELFQSGRKSFAVITEAASAGISLHSDRGRQNSKQRQMICIELPWAADKAVQQFGRVHRSNQRYAPIYHLLVSDVGGEHRFVACIAKRMKTLGAITRGDRRAAFGGGKPSHHLTAESLLFHKDSDDASLNGSKKDVSSGLQQSSSGRRNSIDGEDQMGGMPLLDFDIYSKYGALARSLLFRWLSYYNDGWASRFPKPEVSDPLCVGVINNAKNERRQTYYATNKDFAKKMEEWLYKCGVIEDHTGTSVKKDFDKSKVKDMDRFLNRLLLLPVEQQNDIFDFFNQLHDESIEVAKCNGEYERGVENLNKAFGTEYHIKVVHREVLWSDSRSGSNTVHYQLEMDRGISWMRSQRLLAEHSNPKNNEFNDFQGYYWVPSRHGRETVALVLGRKQLVMGPQRVLIYKPHLGEQQYMGRDPATLKALKEHNWRKCNIQEMENVETSWIVQYELSKTECIHHQVGLQCKNGQKCRIGRRLQEEHLLSGNIMMLWGRLEKWLQTTTKTENDDDDDDDDQLHDQQRKRVLRLIRATVENGPPLVGAKLPVDKLRLIKRNLQIVGPEVKNQCDQLEALFEIYLDHRLYLKILQLIVKAARNVTNEIEIPRDDLWIYMADAIDRKFGIENFSESEIQIINRAFPPSEKGLEKFDGFLQLAQSDRALRRRFDPLHGVALYTLNESLIREFKTIYKGSSLESNLVIHREHTKNMMAHMKSDYSSLPVFNHQGIDFSSQSSKMAGRFSELPPPAVTRQTPLIVNNYLHKLGNPLLNFDNSSETKHNLENSMNLIFQKNKLIQQKNRFSLNAANETNNTAQRSAIPSNDLALSKEAHNFLEHFIVSSENGVDESHVPKDRNFIESLDFEMSPLRATLVPGSTKQPIITTLDDDDNLPAMDEGIMKELGKYQTGLNNFLSPRYGPQLSKTPTTVTSNNNPVIFDLVSDDDVEEI